MYHQIEAENHGFDQHHEMNNCQDRQKNHQRDEIREVRQMVVLALLAVKLEEEDNGDQ